MECKDASTEEEKESKEEKRGSDDLVGGGTALVEKVKTFFYSNEDFAELFEVFAHDNCHHVNLAAEEHSLKYTELHAEFVAIFEEQIEGFIEAEGSDVHEFYRLLRRAQEEDAESDESLLGQIMCATCDYDVFLFMMRTEKQRAIAKLQREALGAVHEFVRERCGLDKHQGECEGKGGLDGELDGERGAQLHREFAAKVGRRMEEFAAGEGKSTGAILGQLRREAERQGDADGGGGGLLDLPDGSQLGLRGNFLFEPMDEATMRAVFELTRKACVEAGDIIVQQGDDGDFFYIILRGRFECYKKNELKRPVMTYSSGGVFGELALMYNCPRAATVEASSDGTLLVLDRASFRKHIIALQKSKGRARAQAQPSDAGGANTDRLAKQKAFLLRKHLTFALDGGLDSVPVWRTPGDTFDEAQAELEAKRKRALADTMARLEQQQQQQRQQRRPSTSSGVSSLAVVPARGFVAARGARVGGNGPNYKSFNDSLVDPMIGTLKPRRAPAERAATPDISFDSPRTNATWLRQQVRASKSVARCMAAAPQCDSNRWAPVSVWNCSKAGWSLSLR
eukprot:g3848.t1